MRAWVWALPIVFLLAACGDSDSHDTPAAAPPQVHADTDWVREDNGRVVLLRGANYSGLEFGNFIGNPHGPQEAHFAQMASWGFNVVRLPIAWNYIEPEPNQFSDQYLVAQVDPVVRFAAQHSISVILEMHQFQWSTCFSNGNGAPAWVCDGHSYPDDSGGQMLAACDFFQSNPGPDGRPLMDHFVDTWRRVAHHYAGDARVIGFDLFNEPIAYGCYEFDAIFDRQVLNPFYRRLRAAVQAEGAQQAFFFTPSVTRNVGVPAYIEPMGPNVVYAPHLYTETWGLPERQYDGVAARITADYGLAAKEASKLGGPLFAGEFGGNTDPAGGFLESTERFLRDSLAEQDRRLIGGAVWAYFPSDNTFSVVDDQGREKGDLVNILARPYARRIAGIPTAMQFDLEGKTFSCSFVDDSAHATVEPTEIFVPAGRHYPGGFIIDVTPGDRWQFDTATERGLLFRGTATVHTVTITPRTSPAAQ